MKSLQTEVYQILDDVYDDIVSDTCSTTERSLSLYIDTLKDYIDELEERRSEVSAVRERHRSLLDDY